MSRAWDEWGFWSWSGTATQANAAGGTIIIDVAAGSGNVLELLHAGAAGTWAAADSVTIELMDEDNTQIVILSTGAAAANATNSYPRANTNVDSTTNLADVTNISPLAIAGPDLRIAFRTSALIQNDTLAVRLWGRVKNGPGTISVARSGGTVAAIAPTVNEVY